MSTLKFGTWENPDGTENFKCRAWVNFNGTGVVAIRASGNVAGITDNGTGDYTVNFTTAMVDANYSASVTGGFTRPAVCGQTANNRTSSSCRFVSENYLGNVIDIEYADASIFH